jgi:hypothetical protein
MRYRETDVIVWYHANHNELLIDIPKGVPLHTMSDGTLRIKVVTPKGVPALRSIVNCVGEPLTKEQA